MFIGHYGVSFAIKKSDRSIPLWVLFLAVQWLDVIWAPLVLLGIERVRIVPGFTATNPLDLYYMPYTHSLVAALLWSVAGAGAYHFVARKNNRASILIGLAVFSHWVLDFVVHLPDLPLYGDTAKVGLGLWNHAALAFVLESVVLLGAMAAYLHSSPRRRTGIIVFGVVMLCIQAYIFFGPAPASAAALAWTALASYGTFALVIWYLADRNAPSRA